MKLIVNNKIQVTVGVFFLALAFTLWEYFNGGVISHHLLGRQDLPKISNWWGLLTIPLLSWLSLFLIHRRRDKKIKSGSNFEAYEAEILKRFLAALAFGIIVSLLWGFNLGSILQYFILFPILIAFFKPVHLPEYLLGFVIGMLFTFGGILPIIIGTVLLILCFLVNSLIRILKNLFSSKSD
ncbi:hypothetical protein CXF68_09380 [Tenacibaculum sp. Bg11-29]|uniref:hypothetical protein n=1 Tax=Tenacibaculum sp. Bg11-29 TaxID=2058306 RepID=UPI000C343D41|nr:hypothetical protein [Tenacibaculum sp. Bg11-29]PKH50885.1 hypothetical protein CXF68_09380 [Tenacibaculum sp. Bg11-29]